MYRILSLCALVVILGITGTALARPQNAQQQPVQAPMSSAGIPATPPKGAPPITGTVLQSLNSGGYTYVLVKNNAGNTWLAMPTTEITPGATMTFHSGMEMANFESKTLKRTFDTIIFSEGPVVDSKKASKENRKSPGSKGAVSKPQEKIKVEKAPGANGYTVAEVYKQKGKLDKKKISVKGKVVKVSSGIMKKNWIHIQDGSGSAKKGNHNLVVTSQSLPLVGDIVTATGTLFKDKDFGGGYKYEIIMEQAELK